MSQRAKRKGRYFEARSMCEDWPNCPKQHCTGEYEWNVYEVDKARDYDECYVFQVPREQAEYLAKLLTEHPPPNWILD